MNTKMQVYLSLLPIDVGFDIKTTKTPLVLSKFETYYIYLDKNNERRERLMDEEDAKEILSKAGYVIK